MQWEQVAQIPLHSITQDRFIQTLDGKLKEPAKAIAHG